ncbi:DNA/RNA non-specific endonuclease [Allomuricauda sp. SCSIO 65647]|uniref:DNA/RNA non-specific endonuclease n=1 Tax=Allomuricauda sp. SCSIO 65647 TaxID=2908843 RepID=UPI001F335D4C|nr:DNA/RNA non-specific endonuclease [Muricauda sp. SCSIO 65647]UJH66311.1 DNA/RNA non-specific endonuclease [Muricauda sp. SCSIO 65647]
MSRKAVYTLLLIICIIGFWLFENFYTPAPYSPKKESTPSLPFEEQFLPSSSLDQLVEHQNYMLSYSEPYEQAEWVAYRLLKEHLTYDDRERPYFVEDPKVRTKSADWRNYKGSGYDRGHLCPAGDRRFSEQAYNETFYTSNIAPQKKDFNAGVWNRLEQQVRYWGKRYGELNVITGGVLEPGLKEIGDEGVDVPQYFYKVVFREDGNELHVLAFLLPHAETTAKLNTFVVALDSLESVTGIDFFEKMPEQFQSRIERNIDTSPWPFSNTFP